MRKSFLAISAALALCAAGARAADVKTPDATLTLSEGSVAAGIGFSWGGGTLTYQGKDYPVSVDGLTLGSVGISEAKASGNVFGLKTLADFDGLYTAAKLGAAVGVGANLTTMSNEHGVVIELSEKTKGLKLTAGPGGVKLKLKP